MKSKIELEKFPLNETARDMMGMVTKGWYDNSYIGKWLFEVMGTSMEDAKQLYEELRLQAFPQTATWGLCYHEQKYGITAKGSIEERRRAVMERKFSRSPFNSEILKDRMESFTGFPKRDIEIIENDKGAHSHKINFIEEESVYIIRTLGLVDYVKKIKQSHAHFDFERFYHMDFRHEINSETALDVFMDFYPRYNLAPLLLDGTWLLDGSRILNGYKSDETFDFNPVTTSIGTENTVLQKHVSSYYISMDTQMKAKQELDTEIKVDTSVHTQKETSVKIQMEREVEHNISADATIEENYWLLDGSVCLDGSRFLNADRIDLTL